MKSLIPILLMVFSLHACREASFKSIDDKDKNQQSDNSAGQGGAAGGDINPNVIPGDGAILIPRDGKGAESLAPGLDVSADKPSLAAGEKSQVTAVLKDGTQNPPVIWKVVAPSGKLAGTIDSNGVYTSPSKVDEPYGVVITAVLTPEDGTSGSTSIALQPGTGKNASPGLSISVDKPTLVAGDKAKASALLKDGTVNPPVIWKVTPPSGKLPGTIDANGVYTSPSPIDAPYGVIITATLLSDGVTTATTPIALVPAGGGANAGIGLVVKVDKPSVSAGGAKAQATATLKGTTNNPPVTWALEDTVALDEGIIDASGVYTSPAKADAPFAVIISATLIADGTTKAYAAIAVVPAAGGNNVAQDLSVFVDKLSVGPGGQTAQATSALKNGTLNPPVEWSVSAPSGKDAGTIDAKGVYKSPALVDVPYAVTITAILSADHGVKGQTAIAIVPLPKPTLQVTVPVASLPIGGKQTQATSRLSTGIVNPPVEWSVSGPANKELGTIDSNGLYTSPANGNEEIRIEIIAILSADKTIKGSVQLDLKPVKKGLIVILPVTELPIGGKKMKAKAKLDDGTENPPVNWSVWAPSGKDPGTIDAEGNYTSPLLGKNQYAINIQAVLKADSNVSAYAPLILVPAKIELQVFLPTNEIKPGGNKLQAKAKLSDGTEDPAVIWSVVAPPGKESGSINPSTGVYTSPAKNAVKFTVQIVAVLLADRNISASVPLTILEDAQVFVRCTRGNAVFPIVADVFSLPIDSQALPTDFTKLTKVTTVCLDRYDVANREFTQGFPDVPNLFEFFALHTKTTLIVPKAGYYTIRLNSDDGSKLFINNQLVINNDGKHPEAAKEAVVSFPAAGKYDVVLDYFQGPRFFIALELFWKKPGTSNFEIIPTENFE